MGRASAALANGSEVASLSEVETLLPSNRRDARLWQWHGLLLRSLDRREEAISSFQTAARLLPSDLSIAHGHARVVLEAGLDAVGLFERARSLNPVEGDVLLGLAAARFASGDATTAMRELQDMLDLEPRWISGHQTLAQLRSLLREGPAFTASFDRALQARPQEPALWQAYLATLIRANHHERALKLLADARQALGAQPFLDQLEVIARSEAGDSAGADRLYARLPADADASAAMHRVRHLLRFGRADATLPILDRWIHAGEGAELWPYASIAWRLIGDSRAAWLEGDSRLVSIIDLAERLPPLDCLAEMLRELHRAQAPHFDQSVRGGTQTDGALFARIEPELIAVRQVVLDAVAGHIAQLPAPDPRHPTLAPRRDGAPRLAGSWSVRLRGGGSHAAHVHTHGWISSALYIASPTRAPDDQTRAGHLMLGIPQAELGIDLPAYHTVEPKPGRLVLFPSTLWHGTIPFAAGERLTIAFDVARPAIV
ncbi:putative 2OG-Fe(II) oxygenase [Sphingomonas xinjiangensis]|uniref:Tetratricopeptide (TPR) repeat protein n=1 Tax=Sphingomonas xinjiangensis TaxID=643568 RepID=A0A840YQT8_9SPHN|nr:putative 2OG-Fe(II) oxygenase [Sphingomonas xinjiangensis]MBB5711342.1 tetratricopeptide (TPR) repeat protein [Sphingomonas xinjiangensis]